MQHNSLMDSEWRNVQRRFEILAIATESIKSATILPALGNSWFESSEMDYVYYLQACWDEACATKM